MSADWADRAAARCDQAMAKMETELEIARHTFALAQGIRIAIWRDEWERYCAEKKVLDKKEDAG